MRSFLGLLLIAGILSVPLRAQTFNGGGGAIPDNGMASLSVSQTVSGLTPAALDATHGLSTVKINITHPNVGDLLIVLQAPDGTELTLVSGTGGTGNNFTNTVFDQSATRTIGGGSAPFTNSYRPVGNIGYLNNGQNGNGTWKLRVFDGATGNAGSVTNWSLTFAAGAPVKAPFTASNLPIIVINTNNTAIPDADKVPATMGIIYNGPSATNRTTDPYNNYNGSIGIELRGSSSQQFPKKPYGIETRTASGDDSDAALLGMPKQSDWVLYPSYSDKSLLNNVLAYKMYRDFGAYAPRTVFAEVMLNKEYMGVYVLIEKLKRDSARIDISKMTTADTAGSGVTGGYIIKVDKTTGSGGSGWYSQIAPTVHPSNQRILFQYEYPKETDIVPKQKAYIKSFVDSFENALNTLPLYDTVRGWRHFADEQSIIRFLLLNEVSKNVDGYRISTYLYKTKSTKGNKLYVGPPWDYDLGFHNANYCDGDKDTGWAYNFGVYSCSSDGNQVPFWWSRLMSADTIFTNKLKCTYTKLRSTSLDTAFLFKYIDSVATQVNAAQARNFEMWPTLGTYVWPNPTPVPSSYAGEITELKEYLKRRLQWLDSHIPGTCWPPPVTPPQEVKHLGTDISCSVAPNPFTDRLRLEVKANASTALNVQLTTIDGRLLTDMQVRATAGHSSFDVYSGNSLPAGIYLLQVKGDGTRSTFRVVKQ